MDNGTVETVRPEDVLPLEGSNFSCSVWDFVVVIFIPYKLDPGHLHLIIELMQTFHEKSIIL